MRPFCLWHWVNPRCDRREAEWTGGYVRQVRTTPNYQPHSSDAAQRLPSNEASCLRHTLCKNCAASPLLLCVFVAVAAVEFIFVIQLMFYSAAESIRSVGIFNLCGLILLVTLAAVTTDFLFIVGHFCLIAWVLVRPRWRKWLYINHWSLVVFTGCKVRL